MLRHPSPLGALHPQRIERGRGEGGTTPHPQNRLATVFRAARSCRRGRYPLVPRRRFESESEVIACVVGPCKQRPGRRVVAGALGARLVGWPCTMAPCGLLHGGLGRRKEPALSAHGFSHERPTRLNSRTSTRLAFGHAVPAAHAEACHASSKILGVSQTQDVDAKNSDSLICRRHVDGPIRSQAPSSFGRSGCFLLAGG